MSQIVIRGARQHNLKGIDLTLPQNALIVITGVSGSGKSSLAFNTLFAEGQRRYLETLSGYARQFLQRFEAPLVDEIEGLSPSIAIEQKSLPRNPRSTVGTLTEIYDHLRLLFARLGTLFCPSCRLPIRAYTFPEMVRELLADWPEGSRLLILAPLPPVSHKDLPGELRRLRKDGFARIRFEGCLIELDPLPLLPRRPLVQLDLVVDRIILASGKVQRLIDSLETASRRGNGITRVIHLDGGEKVFSEHHRCPVCGREGSPPSPTLFSFHHPDGQCTRCKGLGTLAQEISRPASVQSKPSSPRGKRRAPPADGTEDDGPEPPFDQEESVAGESEALLCPQCAGTRLNEEARSVQFGGRFIHEVATLPLPEFRRWCESLTLSAAQAEIARRPLQSIIQCLEVLNELGLSYLTLDRPADSLSGGEAQRIRLAHQVSHPLTGVLYVLDEPSIGLHPRDHRRLLNILFRLRDVGNTVVVVEHDRETILNADMVVDIGPGAGSSGGEVVFAGKPADLISHPSSLTGLYLSGQRHIAPSRRRIPFAQGAIVLRGARGHNLKDITASFPLACLTCVTGVSGSGKSSLVLRTLHRALARRFNSQGPSPLPFDTIENAHSINKVILVDQAPIGRTPRSTPATYCGAFDILRRIFSLTPEARARGYGASRFSFNVKGGRCETCRGEGALMVDMLFMPDLYVTCPACEGTRYRPETLEIRYKGYSIAEVLNLTAADASALFESYPALSRFLGGMIEVGLGYLRLGQPATTLSGGESQRLKLASELSRKPYGKTLYILDEPTTGLHFDDIRKLLHILQRLVDRGHTVVLIEHHMDVIKSCDYIIDLGPEGGAEGGEVVACGTAEELAALEPPTWTSRYLRRDPEIGGG